MNQALAISYSMKTPYPLKMFQNEFKLHQASWFHIHKLQVLLTITQFNFLPGVSPTSAKGFLVSLPILC